MSEERSAKAAIEASPLKVKLTSQHLGLDNRHSMMEEWMTSSMLPSILADVTKLGANNTESGQNLGHESIDYNPLEPIFIVHIFAASYPHKTWIRSSNLHGSWPNSNDRPLSYPAVDLGKRLPTQAGKEGMKIWDHSGVFYDRHDHFLLQRLARTGKADYEGAVPELMSKRRQIMKDWGLVGRALFKGNKRKT